MESENTKIIFHVGPQINTCKASVLTVFSFAGTAGLFGGHCRA